jgi:hypothetical protein
MKGGLPMQISSRNAAMFISLMATSAFTVLIKGALGTHSIHYFLFLSLFLLAFLTSRLKVKLPGLTGNMSVNLPFLFLAITQLSLLEAAVIALASTLVQSLPRDGKPLKLVQVLFNVSTVTTAAGFSYMAFRNHLWPGSDSFHGSLSLVMAAGTFFLVNTLPVATIISLTEGTRVVRTWLGIFQLSFPYYLVGAGITSIVTTPARDTAWQLPMAVLPLMIVMYRSYQIYFGLAAVAAPTAAEEALPRFTKRQAAGAN